MDYTKITYRYPAKEFGTEFETLRDTAEAFGSGWRPAKCPLVGITVEAFLNWEDLDASLCGVGTTAEFARVGGLCIRRVGDWIEVSEAQFAPNGSSLVWCRVSAKDASLADALDGDLNPYLETTTEETAVIAVPARAYRVLKNAAVFHDTDAVLDFVTDYAVTAGDTAACAFADYLGALAEPVVYVKRIVPKGA